MPATRSRFIAALAAIPFVAVSVLGASVAANASKPASDGEHRVAFCHATHSEKNPYVYIETDKVAVVRAHFKHQDEEDVWPAFTYMWHGEEFSYAGSPDGEAFIANGCATPDDGGPRQ